MNSNHMMMHEIEKEKKDRRNVRVKYKHNLKSMISNIAAFEVTWF